MTSSTRYFDGGLETPHLLTLRLCHTRGPGWPGLARRAVVAGGRPGCRLSAVCYVLVDMAPKQVAG